MKNTPAENQRFCFKQINVPFYATVFVLIIHFPGFDEILALSEWAALCGEIEIASRSAYRTVKHAPLTLGYGQTD